MFCVFRSGYRGREGSAPRRPELERSHRLVHAPGSSHPVAPCHTQSECKFPLRTPVGGLKPVSVLSSTSVVGRNLRRRDDDRRVNFDALWLYLTHPRPHNLYASLCPRRRIKVGPIPTRWTNVLSMTHLSNNLVQSSALCGGRDSPWIHRLHTAYTPVL